MKDKMLTMEKSGNRGGVPLLDESMFSPETLRVRQAQLTAALAACSDAFCEFNVTRDTVLCMSAGPQAGAASERSPRRAFSVLTRAWSDRLDPEERPGFLAFLEPERLKDYRLRGKRQLTYTYWVRDSRGRRVPARQDVLLYEDAAGGDLLGLTYVQVLPAADDEGPALSKTDSPVDAPASAEMRQKSDKTGGNEMTIEECYQQMGGNYAEVSARLPSLKLVEKFACRFLEDKSFETLCREMEDGNRKEAFRAAHTLKGVCANLSFDRLLKSAAALTEALRPETDAISDTAVALLEDVRRDYQATVDAIRRYMGERA